MRRIFVLFLFSVFCLKHFAAVKVGDTFVAADGNTYKYTKVAISADSYDIEVSLTNCVQTGNVNIPSEVIDSERYTCTVVSLGLVGYSIFTNPSLVTAITLPNTLKEITNLALTGAKVTRLYIPASVTSIGVYPCGSDTFIEYDVDSDNPQYCSDEKGVLFSKDMKTMCSYPSGKTDDTYSVPVGTTTILNWAFTKSKVETIEIPETVVKWDINRNNDNTSTLKNINVDENNSVFYSEEGVLCRKSDNAMLIYPRGRTDTEYIVPESVEIISSDAFYNNNHLKNIIIGNNVAKLEESAFRNLANLTSISIPASVTDINSGNPFVSCTKLAEINIDEDNPEYKSIDGVMFDKSGETLITYPFNHGADYVVPDGTKHIASRAFYNVTPLESVSFPSTLEDIGTFSFAGCTKLSSVTFAENSTNFKELGTQAFNSCRSLEEISLPQSTEIIGGSVFSGTHIIYFRVPDETTVFGGSVFSGQQYIQTVEFNKKITNLSSSAFLNCTNLQHVTFPEECELKQIPQWTFSGCTNLEPFTIPASVTAIGANSFKDCENLTTVYFEDGSNLTSIGTGSFQDSGIEYITLPDGIKTIANNAFTNCSKLEVVNVPAATTSIDYSAFTHCSSLEEINVDKDNTKYSSSDGILLTKDKETLVIFPAGKANSNFTLLPPSITNIGKLSFYDCENLVSVTIPKKVTTIETRAFYFCPNLKYIAMLGKPATVGLEAFDDGSAAGYSDIKSRATLYVRTRDLTDYMSSDFWKEFPNIETSFENNTEEFLPMSDTYVNMVNSKSNVHSLIIPSTATDTNGKTYHVGLIGDYAFEENDGGKLKEVITFENVEYIGAKAFKQASNPSIKNIIFVQKEPQAQLLSTYRFELMPEDLPGGNDDQYMELDKTYQHIYVRRSDTPQCKVNWPKYEDVITYEIPTTGEFNIIPSAENGTFSREFAVDLSNNGENTVDEGKQGLLAFVPGERFKISDTEYNIRMYSINEGGEGDGTYIPAGTGVLLRKYSDNIPSYYEIAENQSSAENPMTQSIVINSGTIPASTATTYNFYIGKSDGLAHKATKTTNIGVHRAYLSIPIDSDNTGAAKKVTFSFTDPDSTTDINEVMPAAADNDQWFNINGQRVISPSKGLYIRNGKKVVVK